MAQYSQVPAPVRYEEVGAASGPVLAPWAYAGRRTRLSASAAPGDSGEEQAPAAPELCRARIAQHHAGPHEPLCQASASMPSLLEADNPPGENPQEEHENRARPRRSLSSSEV